MMLCGRVKTIWVILLTVAVFGGGCATSGALKGGTIGAVGGGVIGAIIGKQADNTVLGAIIGAAVGGTTGALIGASMDKQAEEMKKDLKGVKVKRVGEGIKLTFDSGILFKPNSAILNATARENIKKLGAILNKYPDTNILVEGHTDSDGSEKYNQELSERRAKAVSNLAMSQGVPGSRFNVMGYGESQPVASNEIGTGKQQNRRVEVAIFANEKMKKAAESGELN